MKTQAEFLQANAIEGRLTPEQAAQLMSLPEGDTGSTPEAGGQPEATTEANTDSEQTQETGKGEEKNEKPPVLMAKDGIHTIDYQKLVDARQGEQHWKAQATAAEARIEALTAEAAQRAAAGQAPTATDNAAAVASAAIESGEVSADLFGDFSEEALAKGVQTLVDARVDARVNEAMAKIDQRLQPLQAQQAQSATEQHYSAIYAKHPDADSIAESAELASWIDRQPSFARDGFKSILQKGTADQIVEFFDAFKQSTGVTQAATPSKASIAAAAKAAFANASAPVPASLTDFPGGNSGPGSKFEAMSALTGPALIDAMGSLTPEQREAYLNRQI